MSEPALTKAQRQHLVEMLAEKFGQPIYWRPYGSGEYRVARKLRALGLVEGNLTGWDGGVQITDRGREIALELKAAAEPDMSTTDQGEKPSDGL